MKRKFIIEIRADEDQYTDLQAFKAVTDVIRGGKVSGKGTAGGAQYCYLTVYPGTHMVVQCYKCSSHSTTQKFVLTPDIMGGQNKISTGK